MMKCIIIIIIIIPLAQDTLQIFYLMEYFIGIMITTVKYSETNLRQIFHSKKFF